MKRPWLAPLTPLYRLGLILRERRLRSGAEPVRRLRWPVVSIGNLSTGGAGKTPLTMALARALTEKGFQVDVLSRGYGRDRSGPARVDPQGTAEAFGDEPLLIAREVGIPVYVSAQRYEAGRLAEAGAPAPSDPGIHLLDDGFQHRQLARDIDILLLNRADWQDRLLPAGNLREPLSAAKRASVMAIPAGESELEADLRAWGWLGPVWRLHRHIDAPEAAGSVAAFCGIARPEQFFAGLEAAGLRLAARTAFADHHRYTARDVERLHRAARAAGAVAIVTTPKDQVRLGSLAAALPDSLPLKSARLRVEIENADAALEWLINRLSTTPPL